MIACAAGQQWQRRAAGAAVMMKLACGATMRCIWPAAALLLAAGCGGSPSGESGGPDAAPAAQIKRRSLESLPKIGDYLPPLDTGRIEIAPPADWNLLPRGTLFEAGFVKGKASELPRITLAAWDSPLDDITELTAENAGRLAAHLLKEMEHDKKIVEEPPRPIILGSTLFLRHVRRAKLPSGGNVVVQALETVRGGRLYVVELLVDVDAPRGDEYEASLTKWRDYGYAVAANLKFTAGESTPPAAAPEAPPAAEKAAEEKPAESPKSS
jgi:hypothetical protein